jgi:hypothetical protein
MWLLLFETEKLYESRPVVMKLVKMFLFFRKIIIFFLQRPQVALEGKGAG